MQERSMPAEAPIGAPVDAGGASPRVGGTGLDDPRALQILTTEHWSLLASRSLAYNESFTRAGMFITALTGTIVALGLVAQAIGFGTQLGWLAILLLGFDLVLGFGTLVRMSETDLADLRSVQAMNRVRHAYLEISPAVSPYLSASAHDDLAGIVLTYGSLPESERWGLNILHGLGTLSTAVGFVVALLIAALAGLVAAQLGVVGSVAIGIAVVALLLTVVMEGIVSARSIARLTSALEVRFPTPPRT